MPSFGRHFQVIFDNAPVGILIMDNAGRPLYTNRALQSMLGFTEVELRDSELIQFIHPDDRAIFQDEFSSLVVGDTSRLRSFGRYQRKDSTDAWWRIDITHVLSSEHSPFIFGFIEDVTEQKVDAERLRRAKEFAERATRTKSAFLANMSHEIRTPIHTITGMTELLLETVLDDEQREYAQQVRFSAEVLLGLINDILDFSKIEAGKLSLENIAFDLFTMTEDAVDMVSMEAHKKALEVVLYLDPELPDIVVGDPVRLRQIIVNLVNNSVKFTKEGEVMIRVEPIERKEDSATILFEVVDTGIGIPQEKLARLFQAFTQVDSTTTRRFGGSGLGLSISRSLVKLMNGTIGVKSQEGRGSTFWFLIPFEGRHGDEKTCRKLLPRFAEKSALLVDDNETFRKQTRRYLSRWFNNVEEATSGPAALELMHARAAGNHPFDVALVDLMLPGMDGWQFASEVNADKGINSTRLILMSPTGMVSGETKMKLLGWFNAYVNKPLKIRELYDALAGALSSDMDLASVEDEPQEVVPLASLEPAEPQRKARILVAEDHMVNQELFKTILVRLGHTVTLANNGREAFEATRKQQFDLIFMDVQMPEMNGYEASREIRRAGISVPIVAVTANAMKGERERCMEFGMNDFLTKPFRTRDVVPVILKWVHSEPDGNPSSKSSPTPRKSGTDRAASGAKPAVYDDAIFNFSGAVEAFMGKSDVVRRIVREFIGRIEEQLVQIRDNLENGNPHAAVVEAHAIKGGSWNLEIKRLGDAAAMLEQIAREGSTDDAILQLDKVRAAFEEFRDYCFTLPEMREPAETT